MTKQTRTNHEYNKTTLTSSNRNKIVGKIIPFEFRKAGEHLEGLYMKFEQKAPNLNFRVLRARSDSCKSGRFR
ncbi:hypothetical protein Hanom_Chr06g00565551 [Helianthus anomalus]